MAKELPSSENSGGESVEIFAIPDEFGAVIVGTGHELRLRTYSLDAGRTPRARHSSDLSPNDSQCVNWQDFGQSQHGSPIRFSGRRHRAPWGRSDPVLNGCSANR